MFVPPRQKYAFARDNDSGTGKLGDIGQNARNRRLRLEAHKEKVFGGTRARPKGRDIVRVHKENPQTLILKNRKSPF